MSHEDRLVERDDFLACLDIHEIVHDHVRHDALAVGERGGLDLQVVLAEFVLTHGQQVFEIVHVVVCAAAHALPLPLLVRIPRAGQPRRELEHRPTRGMGRAASVMRAIPRSRSFACASMHPASRRVQPAGCPACIPACRCRV